MKSTRELEALILHNLAAKLPPCIRLARNEHKDLDMKSFLATCHACKRTSQVSAEVASKRAAERSPTGRILAKARVSWRVVGGVHSGATSRLDAAWNGRWTITLPCPGCNESIAFEGVAGTVTAHVCNDKCMSSKGHQCECSCGGRNHGRAFAA